MTSCNEILLCPLSYFELRQGPKTDLNAHSFLIPDPYSYAHTPDKHTTMSATTDTTADTTSGDKTEEKKEETSETTTTTTTSTTSNKQAENKSMKKVRSKKGKKKSQPYPKVLKYWDT